MNNNNNNNNRRKRRITKDMNDNDNNDRESNIKEEYDDDDDDEQEEEGNKRKRKDIRKEMTINNNSDDNNNNNHNNNTIVSSNTTTTTTTTTNGYVNNNVGQRRQSSRAIASASSLTVDDEEEEKEIQNIRSMNIYLQASKDYHIEIPKIQLKSQVSTKWSRNQSETVKELAKSAARVMLMKGGKGDKLSFENVRGALGEYKALVRPAIRDGQQLLQNIFGYDVILTKDPDHIYIVNKIKSPILRRILSEVDNEAGYRGFCFTVFIAIWTSPGRKIDAFTLLKHIRKIDPRFATNSLDNLSIKKKESSSIDDLDNESFLGLVNRMIKEGYITEARDEVEFNNIQKKIYEFGPRFYIEIGLKQLVCGYFASCNLPVDDSILAEIDKLGDGFLMDNAYEQDEVGGDVGNEETKQNRK